MAKPTIYTIGHSTHPIDYFLEMLLHKGVNCVVDVRSLAASRFNPQYNKKALFAFLNAHKVEYIHLPQAFGARQTDPAVLDAEGRVDFEKLRDADDFKEGVRRLSSEAANYTVALMCSEADPLQCHRFGMIAPALNRFDVKHILKDKSILSQHDLEMKLLQYYVKKWKPNLFESPSTQTEMLSDAYRMLNREIAYSPAEHKRDFKR
jgi:uncharacterized protein (DUF488 family)